MKKLLILLISISFHSFLAGQDAIKDINTLFNQYKTAVIAGKHLEAIQYMDRATLDYYHGLLDKVWTADSTAIESFSTVDKFVVLFIRHLAPKKQILAFTDNDFIVYTMEQGFAGKETVKEWKLGRSKINNNHALMILADEGKAGNQVLEFNKENDQWKINLVRFFMTTDDDYQDMLIASKKTENELLFGMMELMSQRKPLPTVWEKVK